MEHNLDCDWILLLIVEHNLDCDWSFFFTLWNNLGDILIPLHSESLEEHILFVFPIGVGMWDIFTVLNYCILIAKFQISCQCIHNNSAIDLFQYLIEFLKKTTKNRILYLYQSIVQAIWTIFSFYMKNCKMLSNV